MFLIKLLEITLMMYLSIHCISDTDKELIEELKELKVTSRCSRDMSLPTISYNIYLCENDEAAKRKKSKNNSSSEYHLKMYAKNEVRKLIQKLKIKKGSNLKLTFILEKDRSKLLEFIRFFVFLLEKNEVKRVEIYYKYSDVIYNFYDHSCFYIEILENKVRVLKKLENFKRWIIEKREISKEYLTILVRSHVNLYFEYEKDEEKKELISYFFLNSKLLSMNFDTFKEDKCLLEKESVHNNIPELNYLNILFYFLKDTHFLNDMVNKFIKNPRSEEYILYEDIYRIGKNSAWNRFKALFRRNSTSFVPDDVCTKIKEIKIREHPEIYKRTLISFYFYLKSLEDIDSDKIVDICRDICNKEKHFKEANITVLKRLISYFTELYPNDCSYFYYDFFDTREYCL